jgi:hypothetical protein
MKKQALEERTDITLDYDQFIRIYNFEKGRQPQATTAGINTRNDGLGGERGGTAGSPGRLGPVISQVP